jgi:hypothetical protein
LAKTQRVATYRGLGAVNDVIYADILIPRRACLTTAYALEYVHFFPSETQMIPLDPPETEERKTAFEDSEPV